MWRAPGTCFPRGEPAQAPTGRAWCTLSVHQVCTHRPEPRPTRGPGPGNPMGPGWAVHWCTLSVHLVCTSYVAGARHLFPSRGAPTGRAWCTLSVHQVCTHQFDGPSFLRRPAKSSLAQNRCTPGANTVLTNYVVVNRVQFGCTPVLHRFMFLLTEQSYSNESGAMQVPKVG
jgi:hypothetical protein